MAKIEYFGIYQSVVWADSESLRNPALRLYLAVVSHDPNLNSAFIRIFEYAN